MFSYRSGAGGPRDIAVCRHSYSANERSRRSSYGGKFPDGYEVQTLDLEALARVICKSVYSSSIFKDGVRLNSNFIRSHYCVLDFDDPRYTLKQARNDWQGSVCLIGTTGTHDRPKVDAVTSKLVGEPVSITCDRFRIVTPWERAVESAFEFTRNVAELVERYGGDRSCVDPARLWYPCTRIEFMNADGYLQPVKPFAAPLRIGDGDERLAEQSRALHGKNLPRWIAAFVHHGTIPRLSDGRQRACRDCAYTLKGRGWTAVEVLELLHNAAFQRADFDSREIDQAVSSAYKDRR